MARQRGTLPRRPGRAVWPRTAHSAPLPPLRSSAQCLRATPARTCLRRALAPVSAAGLVYRASGRWRPRVAANSHRRGESCSDAAEGGYRRIEQRARREAAPVSRALPEKLSPFYHHTRTLWGEWSTSRRRSRRRPNVIVARRRSYTRFASLTLRVEMSRLAHTGPIRARCVPPALMSDSSAQGGESRGVLVPPTMRNRHRLRPRCAFLRFPPSALRFRPRDRPGRSRP